MGGDLPDHRWRRYHHLGSSQEITRGSAMKAVFIIVVLAVITPLSSFCAEPVEDIELLVQGINNLYDGVRMCYICLSLIVGVLLFICARLK